MRIGFAKENITPPLGIPLGGYAGYRPCAGVHDPLFCKAVVLEQEGVRYALVALDLLCVDGPLYHRIAQAVAPLGIAKERLIAAAIHSHASPLGVIPGQGQLAAINCADLGDEKRFAEYMELVVSRAAAACQAAVSSLEGFALRCGQRSAPPVGSERHTGETAYGSLTAIQFLTDSGKNLIIYSLPCHPTVMRPENLEVSADFVADIEALTGVDMAVFLNGAAGDISTRFTRRESTFAECRCMAAMVAQALKSCLEPLPYTQSAPLEGSFREITLKMRPVEPEAVAAARLEALTAQYQQAADAGADPASLRVLQSQVEGAGVNLEFSRAIPGMDSLSIPVTAFRLAGLSFYTIPGELFSTLAAQTQGVAICYANGYDRYIADTAAYDAGYYEALAAVLARGEGEKLMNTIQTMLQTERSTPL